MLGPFWLKNLYFIYKMAGEHYLKLFQMMRRLFVVCVCIGSWGLMLYLEPLRLVTNNPNGSPRHVLQEATVDTFVPNDTQILQDGKQVWRISIFIHHSYMENFVYVFPQPNNKFALFQEGSTSLLVLTIQGRAFT